MRVRIISFIQVSCSFILKILYLFYRQEITDDINNINLSTNAVKSDQFERVGLIENIPIENLEANVPEIHLNRLVNLHKNVIFFTLT